MAKKEISYKEAVTELQDILAQLQEENVDIDEVAIKVKRAVELIRLCRAKIEKTEVEISSMVKNVVNE